MTPGQESFHLLEFHPSGIGFNYIDYTETER